MYEKWKLKQTLRKGITENIPCDVSQEFTFHICGRVTLFKAGLVCHKRSRNNNAVTYHTCTVCEMVFK